jgi:hypothetical protein
VRYCAVETVAGIPAVEEYARQAMVLLCAGCGLMLVAAIQVVGTRWPRPARTGAAAAAVALAAAGPFTLGGLAEALATAAVMVGVVAAYWFLTSARPARALQAALAFALDRRAGARAAFLGVAGTAFAVGAVVKFDRDDEAEMDRADALLAELVSQPPMRPADAISATTDRGRAVRVRETTDCRPDEIRDAAEKRLLVEFHAYDRVIRLAPSDDSCNCHGWVFAGGRYWVSHVDVENILVDNGYVAVTDPRPGDLAIYRDSAGGMVSHTGVVRAVVPGMPPLVEGKWGWMGVFLHRVGDSPYGTNCAFYRSQRDGHLVAGVGGPPRFADAAEKGTGAR